MSDYILPSLNDYKLPSFYMPDSSGKNAVPIISYPDGHKYFDLEDQAFRVDPIVGFDGKVRWAAVPVDIRFDQLPLEGFGVETKTIDSRLIQSESIGDAIQEP